MLILRVETPGHPQRGRDWMTSSEQYAITKHWCSLPCPYDDKIRGFNGSYVCGAQSLELFHRWWPIETIPLILSSGGSIVILSYPKRKIKFGNTQCIFKRSEGRQVGYMCPDGSLVYTDKRIKNFIK